jgi:PPM family protein phosphatase
MKLQHQGLTDKGMVRSANQDSYHMDPQQRFFLVADGMGGHAGGEEASRIAIETAASYFNANWDSDIDTKSLIEQSLIAANDAIVLDQEANPQRADMGTTIVGILCRQDLFWSTHVGDSRLYRLRDKKLDLLTEDDTWREFTPYATSSPIVWVEEICAKLIFIPKIFRSAIVSSSVAMA